MGLTFQMISSGKGLNVKTTASAGSSGTEGANAIFSQTLVQSMAGAASEAAVSNGNTAAALLNRLMTAVSGEADKDGEMAGVTGQELLDQILPGLEKLDEHIELNPALLAALQGWLIQASAVSSGADAQEGQNQSALTLLAQNPATARFAVQDELHNLAAMIQQAAKNGDDAAAGKALSLLNSFAAMLESYAGDGLAFNGTAAQSPASNAIMAGKLEEHHLQKAGDVKASDNLPGYKMMSSTEGKEHIQANEDTSSELAGEPDASSGDSKVITAGQLQLREGITASQKTEPPQVPVQKFAQEMTGFITGKLEIVKKGGTAEATISLFPENLGQVDVKITMQNGHLVAHFLTEHAGAKDLLENQMSQLRAALQSQGLQVEKLEVTQSSTSQQSQFFQEGRHSGAGGQGSDRRSKERKEASDDAILAAELDGEWKEWLTSERQGGRDQTGRFSAKA